MGGSSERHAKLMRIVGGEHPTMGREAHAGLLMFAGRVLHGHLGKSRQAHVDCGWRTPDNGQGGARRAF